MAPVLQQRQPLGLLQHIRTRRGPRCAAGLSGPFCRFSIRRSCRAGSRPADASSRVGKEDAEMERLKPGWMQAAPARSCVDWSGLGGMTSSRAPFRVVPRA